MSRTVLQPFYDDAAHLLKMLMAAGLEHNPARPYHETISFLAETLDSARRSRLSQSDEALTVVAALSFLGLARWEPCKVERIKAIIGTVIGNIQTSGRVC